MGKAKIRTGIAKPATRFIGFGSNLTKTVARIIPRNSEPASPMYILAGFLFQYKNPKQDPESTIARAAI